MSELHMIETVRDDSLVDEALDRPGDGKLTSFGCASSRMHDKDHAIK